MSSSRELFPQKGGRAREARPRSRGLVTRLLLALALSFTAAVTAGPASAAAVVGDGQSAATAAASCWEIKQHDPQAADGAYWLVTPALGSPQKFYCDQTTDGGGWVMVGRGRDWWFTSNEGRGDAAAIWQTPTGSAAFEPRQLPVHTITGLLDGQPVDELPDGVRLRRATNTSGTSWQEVRFNYASARDAWSWQFAGVQQVGAWRVDSATGNGGTTGSFGTGTGLQRVDTNIGRNRWANGFGYGSSTRGSPDSSSFLWSSSTSQGYARPFTQVFVRPQLLSSDIFEAIPARGLDAVPSAAAVAESFPAAAPWGVSGLGAAGGGELNTEVAAFTEIDGVMYVGGNFRYVQRNAGGQSRVEQSYLAAFDAESGEWLSGFRPKLNNQVKALAALPDGNLAVGGAFTSANDATAAAFVVVDPVAGATVTGFDTRLVNYTGGAPPIVRSLDVQGGYLYLGGAFTHMIGGGDPREVYLRNIGRVAVGSGAPDGSWNPLLNGTVVDLDASPHGDRVYAAGYFGLSNWDTPTVRAGAFHTSDASVIPWTVDFSRGPNYQQAVREVGDRVWLGGAEHMLFSYDRSTMDELSTNITQAGGDFQVIADDGSHVIAGCHCTQNVYQGARYWPSIRDFYRVEHIDQAGYWNAQDASFEPTFSPVLSMREGSGAWAIEVSEGGSLWLGGDFTHVRLPNSNNRWAGGFVRFNARDTSPPQAPTRLSVTATGDSDHLTWSAPAGQELSYEILRTDRVVATTSDTSIDLPGADLGTRYFVRAVDDAENRSASTQAASATEHEDGPVTLVAAGQEWAYHFDSEAPNSSWAEPDFDDSTWTTGPAPLGWGHTDLGTTLTTPGTKPLTSYYRHDFTVEDATQIEALTLTTRADDGIVIYLNGTEVGRHNMPDGAPTHRTYATAAPTATQALANPLTIEASSALLTTGTNTITAEVHSERGTTPSHSFELTATEAG